MATTTQHSKKPRESKNGQLMMPPDIVRLISAQDYWTEKDYLALDESIGAWMIELVNYRLEILPMPTPFHQDIVIFLMLALREFVLPRRLGRVYVSPMPVRLFPGTMREPDNRGGGREVAVFLFAFRPQFPKTHLQQLPSK